MGCGFYPDTGPGEGDNTTAATFDEARVALGAAWQAFLLARADFQAWRDRTVEKYAMWNGRIDAYPKT